MSNANIKSKRANVNACEKRATEDVNDGIQTLERWQRERYTSGSKDKMLGQLRWEE